MPSKLKLDLPKARKCNEESLRRYIREKHVEVPGSVKTLIELATIVRDHMLKTITKDRIAGCDNCGGDSDADLSECPYCGDDESDTGTTANNDTSKEPAAMKTSKKTGKKVGKKKVSKKTTSKKTTKKTASKKTSKTNKTNKTTAITKAPKVEVSSAALEEGLKKVRVLQKRGVECMHDLGCVLFDIYEKKLYTQKVDSSTGKPIYDSWTKFCSKEIGIAAQYAYRLMDVAAHFSKEQVAEVGVTKLNLLVRVPEEKRQQLLSKAASTPRSAIAEEVARLAGSRPRETGRKGFTGKSAAGNKPKKSEKLTVVRSEPRIVVDLFERGGTKRSSNTSNAVGVEKCANGVMIHYSLMADQKGNLSIAIETRRET